MQRIHPKSSSSAIPRRTLLSLGAAAACASIGLLPRPAAAQSYPVKPIRMIVIFPPGGGLDAMGRMLAEKMSTLLKQNIFVDNKVGAGGSIGIAYAARTPNDGYTVLLANDAFTTNPSLSKSPGFDPIKDFEPVAMVGTNPFILAIHPNLPAKNLMELIAMSAKAPITVASPGFGTSPHLFGELLNLKTPLKLRLIQYRGSGPAIIDALGGQTNAVLTSAFGIIPHINSGKLRGIAITSDTRSPLLPELPTLEEAGIKGYTHEIWNALFVPAGTPQAVVVRLRDAVMTSIRDPDWSERLRKAGVDPVVGDDQAVARLIKSDLQRWSGVIAEANIRRE